MTGHRNPQPIAADYEAAERERQSRARLNLEWLVRLRWLAAGALFGLVITANLGGVDLPVVVMLALVGVTALSNIGLQYLLTRPSQGYRVAGGVAILLDSTLLTVLLALSGGAVNPFSSLYLLHVVLAALILPPLWTWFTLAFSALAYGSLYLLPSQADHGQHMGSHLFGMWIAFLITGPFIVYTVTRLRRELADFEARARHTRELRSRNERLASLATLAAGAAHELATPLGTIAIAAGELARNAGDQDGRLARDASLISAEIDRCMEVVHRLAADTASGMGEAVDLVSIQELLQSTVTRFADDERLVLDLAKLPAAVWVLVPPGQLTRALGGLVKNALEASPADASVKLVCSVREQFICIEIQDRGSGVPESILKRLGEPFFTTKEAGMGMGLGVFFARSVIESAGGRLTIESTLGEGTTSSVQLPRAKGPAESQQERV